MWSARTRSGFQCHSMLEMYARPKTATKLTSRMPALKMSKLYITVRKQIVSMMNQTSSGQPGENTPLLTTKNSTRLPHTMGCRYTVSPYQTNLTL